MKSKKQIAQRLSELLRDDIARLLRGGAYEIKTECGHLVVRSRIPYPDRMPIQIHITISEEIENDNPTT